MKDDKKVLREFIREALKEDAGGWNSSAGMFGDYGFGMANYGPSLKSWAIDPFLDVGKVFKASAMKLATRAKTLISVVLEAALTTAIPFLQSNYTLIFKHEKEELVAIRKKYADAFSAVDKAFDSDVMVLSFMISPTAFITAAAAARAPEAVLSSLEMFSHGSEKMAQYFADVHKRLKQIHKDLRIDPDEYKIDKHGMVVGKNARGPYMTIKKRQLAKQAGINDALEFDDEVMFEDVAQQQMQQQPQAQSPEQQAGAFMQQVLADPNVQRMIVASPLAKQMQADAKRIADDLAGKILHEAQHVMQIQTIEQLQQVCKKPLGVEKLSSLQPQERQQAEQAVVKQVKAAMKQFYVKTLEGEIQNTLKQGVDPNNLYISTLKRTMTAINKLS